MIAQSKMLILISLAGVGWGERLARALEGDGEGNAALLAWEGAPHVQEICTAEEFALIQSESTHDDFIRLAATLPGSAPGPCCMRTVNCGQTLATMGRLRDFLPNTFSRVVTVLNDLGWLAAEYSSNFTAGVDGWSNGSDANIVLTGNTDAINSENDWLKIERVTTPGPMYIAHAVASIVPGATRRMTMRVFNPPGSTITHVKVTYSGFAAMTPVAVAVPAGTAVNLDVTYAYAGAAASTNFRIEPCNAAGVLASALPTGTIYYVKNITLQSRPELLSPNTVYSLTVNPPANCNFIMSAGAAIGDQIDFTTENLPVGGAAFTMKGSAGEVLRAYDLETTDRVRYLTAVWNGTAWEVKQS